MQLYFNHNICKLFNSDGADLLRNHDLHVEDGGELREPERNKRAEDSDYYNISYNFVEKRRTTWSSWNIVIELYYVQIQSLSVVIMMYLQYICFFRFPCR